MAKEPFPGRQSGAPSGDRPSDGQHDQSPARTVSATSGDTLAETATAAAESAQAAASDQIEQHKAAASQSLEAFAKAVRKASDELSSQDQTAAARLIREAAGGLESFSQSLANQSLEDMVGTVRDFGRRNPAALAGGAALVGLALGRFARSSSSPAQGAYAQSATGPSARGGTESPGGFPASRASVAARPETAQSEPTTQHKRADQPQHGGAGAKRSGGFHE
jgi:hypothetical protein